MSDLKKNIIKNILDKKFNKANDDFASLMKDKTHGAIQDFKTSFKYTKLEPDVEPTDTTPEETNDG